MTSRFRNELSRPLVSRGRFFAALLLATLAGIGPARAQLALWTGNTSTDWNTGSNWSTGSVPSSSATDASLDTNSGNQSVLSSGDLTIGNITIGNTTASGANTTLTIQSGGELNSASAFIGLSAGATGAATITDASSTWNTANLTLGGSGSGNLTIASGGLLEINNGNLLLAQNSTATAVLNLNSGGTLQLSDTNGIQAGLGSYAFNWAGGTLQINATVTTAINATLVAGTTSILQDTLTIGQLTFSGVLSGAGSFTKSGSGILFLTGNNTYTGATSITGAVFINGTNASLGAGGSVALTAGSTLEISNQHLGGVLNAQGGLTLASGGGGNGTTLDIDIGGTLQLGGVNGFQATGGTIYTDNWVGGTVEVVGSDLTGSANATLAANSTSTFDTNGLNATLSGNIGGSGNLVVTGNGTLTLSGPNTYSGTTMIAGGTLALSGTSANISPRSLNVGLGGLGNLTISGGASIQNSNITIGNATNENGTLTVTGTNSKWVDQSQSSGQFASLTVGNIGAVSLDITNGGNVTCLSGTLGNKTGSVGTALVTGVGSKWFINGGAGLNVGNLGTGNLTIANGGNVTAGGGNIGNNVGSIGTVLVTDASSKWVLGAFTIGNLGVGNLTIANGGNVTANGLPDTVGDKAGSSGTLLITGTGSELNGSGSPLNIGNLGTGCLTIANGGNVTSLSGFIGNNAGSNGTVLVTDAGSTWTRLTALDVGNLGTGNLTIANGGNVTLQSFITTTIGVKAGSSGTLSVSGTGSIFDTPTLTVGNLGVGTLLIGSGANVTISGNTVTIGALGNITQTGGNLTGNGSAGVSLSIIAGGVYNLDGGTVQVASATGAGNLVLAGGNLALSANGSIALSSINLNGGNLDVSALNGNYAVVANQALTGSGNIIGAVTINGTLSPGGTGTAGTLTFNQNLVLGSSATLSLQVGGTAPGTQSSALNVTGNLTFGGTLVIDFINGFEPDLDDNYALIVSTGTPSGAFSSVLLPHLSSGLDWNLAQLYTTGDLATAAPTTFAAWTADTGLAGGNATASAEPFTDGMPNLLRYAMNLDSTPTPPGLPVIASTKVSGVTYLTISYRQRKNMSDVQLVPQFSTDLANWTNVDAGNITQLSDDDTYTARAQAQVVVPASGLIFLRITAETTP